MKRVSNSDTHVRTRGKHMCSPGTQTREIKAHMCVHAVDGAGLTGLPAT